MPLKATRKLHNRILLLFNGNYILEEQNAAERKIKAFKRVRQKAKGECRGYIHTLSLSPSLPLSPPLSLSLSLSPPRCGFVLRLFLVCSALDPASGRVNIPSGAGLGEQDTAGQAD